MQIITMYLRADSVNARLVDSYNQTISAPGNLSMMIFPGMSPGIS